MCLFMQYIVICLQRFYITSDIIYYFMLQNVVAHEWALVSSYLISDL